MSDFARLKGKLELLRARERAPGEGRKLKGADAATRLASLIAEIDETILPRRLSLTNDKGVVYLAVANRRLQAMLGPVPSVKGAKELQDQALPDAEDPGVPALLSVLKLFFKSQSDVSLGAHRLDKTFGSDIGVPANLLARAWDVEPKAAKAPKLPVRFCRTFWQTWTVLRWPG